ncbi:glycosyltransferase family 4 protein, partial [Candidatus Pelagibacter sp.]|nr:glycosyltransferase family 4 protein [Candidatus Pelagibacter sp.]
ILLLDHQDNIADYFNIFDCYISASRWETFGISLIEAMSFDLPIITSVHEGNEEWIYDHDVNIFLSNDVSDLTLKILNAYKNKPKKKKYNLKQFNYEEICNNILEFYKNI